MLSASRTSWRSCRRWLGGVLGIAGAWIGASAAHGQVALTAPRPSFAITEILPPVDVAPYSAKAWAISGPGPTVDVAGPRVVGEFGLGSVTPNRPFIWNRVTQAVDLLPGTIGTGVARNINGLGGSTGTIVLPLLSPLPSERAFYAAPGGGVTLLAGVAGHGAWGFALNNARTIVGSSYVPSGQIHATGWLSPSTGTPIAVDLGTLAGGTRSEAYSISAAGQVVGVSRNAANIDRAVVLYPNFPSPLAVMPVWRDLGSLVLNGFSVARDVNDTQQAAGQSQAPSTTATAIQSRAVVWYLSPLATSAVTRIINLGVVASAHTQSDALAINNRVDVVGWSGGGTNTTPSPQAAFLWRAGRMYDLNTTIPSNSGWRLLVATDINDAGQIVGWGYKPSPIATIPTPRAFLLTPAPAASAGGD